MANYATLKTSVNNVITTNGNNEITGALLNQLLISIIDSLGAQYQFVGVATPSTSPGTPDYNVAYIGGPGTYPNFNSLVIPAGYIGILKYNGSWHLETIDISLQVKELAILLAKSSYGISYNIPNNGTVLNSFIKRDVSTAKYVLISSYMDAPSRIMLAFFDENGARMSYDVKQSDGVLNADTGNYELVVPVPSGAKTCAAGKLNIGDRTVFLKVVPDLTNVLNDVISDVSELNSFAANVMTQYVAQADNTPIIGYEALKDYANKIARSIYGTKYEIPEEFAASPINTRRDVEGAQFVFVSSYVDNPVRKMLIFMDADGTELTQYSITQNYGLLNTENNCYEICVPVPAGAKFCAGGKVNAGTRNVYLKVINGDSFINLINSINELLESSDLVEIKSVTDEFTIIPSETANLINPGLVTTGYIDGSNGRYYSSESYMVTDYIPVTPNVQYKVMCRVWNSTYYFRHVCFYDENKIRTSGITTAGATFTVPTTAKYARVSLYRKPTGTIIPPEDYGLFLSTITEFEEWYGNSIAIPSVPLDKKTNQSLITKDDLEQAISGQAQKKLTIMVNGPVVRILDKNGNYTEVATNYRESRNDNVFASEGIFNFLSTSYNGNIRSSTFKDDIAPAHFLNTTLGANHAQPCVDATVQNHGLTNAAVGTGWVKDGKTYYIVCIVDANTIRFLSQNDGTAANPSYTALTVGTLTNGANSLAVTSVATAQMHPASKNHSIRIVLDGETVVSNDGTYYANTVDFVESYDVLDPYSVLLNLIAHVGTTTPPVYDGNVAAHIENVYRFQSNMAVLVISNFIAKENIAFQDIMFSQAMIIGADNSVKYYLPNSSIIDGYNMTQPLTINWANVVNSLYVPAPINRVLQFDGTHGFAIGFDRTIGVGKSLENFTDHSFELRRGTGKVYPHGVDKDIVGASLEANQLYSAIMYRCPFIPEVSGNRLSMYYYELNGKTYAFIDYSGTMFDNIVISDELNGKPIKVIESKNAVLLGDIYNGGFNVNAQFVAGETCYIIVEIG